MERVGRSFCCSAGQAASLRPIAKRPGCVTESRTHGPLWHTFQQVKPRFTTWLLATLLAFVACFSVPVARVESTRASHTIVWVDESRRTEGEIAEPRRASQPALGSAALTGPPGV